LCNFNRGSCTTLAARAEAERAAGTHVPPPPAPVLFLDA